MQAFKESIPFVKGVMWIHLYHFHYALTLLALYPNADETRKQVRSTARACDFTANTRTDLPIRHCQLQEGDRRVCTAGTGELSGNASHPRGGRCACAGQ